ncbi:hypothetical protein Bbelb_273850 [Branchiostoma belcheri]|nr:hypothetical protein Bbelb_273850 [Branchiostoma belcheri]
MAADLVGVPVRPAHLLALVQWWIMYWLSAHSSAQGYGYPFKFGVTLTTVMNTERSFLPGCDDRSLGRFSPPTAATGRRAASVKTNGVRFNFLLVEFKPITRGERCSGTTELLTGTLHWRL